MLLVIDRNHGNLSDVKSASEDGCPQEFEPTIIKEIPMGKKEKITTLKFYKSEISTKVRLVFNLRRADWTDSMLARLRTLLAEIVDLCVKTSEVKGVFKADIRCFDQIKSRLEKIQKLLNLITDLDEKSFTRDYKTRKFYSFITNDWYV